MATNIIADKLINFEVFRAGERQLGTADVSLPSISYKTATLSGAGIGGDIEMPTPGQTESMELELNWRTLSEGASNLLALRSHDFELRGAVEQYDGGTGELVTTAVKINVRGLTKSTELGAFKPADHTDTKTTLEVLYLKVSIAGVRKVEIDKLNYVHFVDGIDYLAQAKAALGL